MNFAPKLWQRYIRPIVISSTASPILPSVAKAYILRLVGVRVGAGCYIYHGVAIRDVRLDLGDNVVLGSQIYIDATAPVVIAERCHIGPRVTILSVTHTIQPDVYRRDPSEVRLLGARIERGCWIGANSTILPGVTIEEGCVIGAGSIVTRSCTANGLYVGAPARRIRDLPIAIAGPASPGL